MNSNQRKYIEYVKNFAETSRNHIWLGGSFLRGNPTPFSDVDISAYMGIAPIKTFINGYGKPIYISYTTNPKGIIIVIYEDGVAVDLEVIESIDITNNDFFHRESIKDNVYLRNTDICKSICQRNDLPYQTARLFHRSLIKYLAGKNEIGVCVANEISSFLNNGFHVMKNDYRNGITCLIEHYHDKYPLDTEYRKLCFELINCIENESDFSK